MVHGCNVNLIIMVPANHYNRFRFFCQQDFTALRNLQPTDRCIPGSPTNETVTVSHFILRWMPTRCHPVLSDADDVRMVHLQRFNGYSPTGSGANDARTVLTPSKVPRPLLAARVKQPYSSACQRVAPVSASPLVTIAMTTNAA